MLALKRKTGFGILALLLAFAILFVLFEDKAEDWLFTFLTENGPLSVNEALNIVSVPLYRPNQESDPKYFELDVIHYFFDYGAEQILDTYFISKKSDSRVRVALMKTYRNLYPSVDISRDERVSITWADRGVAQPCKIPSYVYDKDRISGDLYRSCLAWLADGNHYVFYSVWPEDEAINFVNSLIEIKKENG